MMNRNCMGTLGVIRDRLHEVLEVYRDPRGRLYGVWESYGDPMGPLGSFV